MPMSELKQRLYKYELAKIGFPNSEYIPENKKENGITEPDKIMVNRDDTRMPEINNAGDVKFSPAYSHMAHNQIVPLANMINEITAAWENSRPLPIENLSQYNILAEYNNFVLAARDDGQYGRGLYFATWKYENDREGVHTGFYTENYADAKESFALRSGLIQKEKVITKEQAAHIKTAIDYSLGDCQSYAYAAHWSKINANLCHAYPEIDKSIKPQTQEKTRKSKKSLEGKLNTAKNKVRENETKKTDTGDKKKNHHTEVE